MDALHTDIAVVVDELVAKEAPGDSLWNGGENKIGALLRLQGEHLTEVSKVGSKRLEFQKYLADLKVLLGILVSRRR